jgi:hypothetical protein
MTQGPPAGVGEAEEGEGLAAARRVAHARGPRTGQTRSTASWPHGASGRSWGPAAP